MEPPENKILSAKPFLNSSTPCRTLSPRSPARTMIISDLLGGSLFIKSFPMMVREKGEKNKMKIKRRREKERIHLFMSSLFLATRFFVSLFEN